MINGTYHAREFNLSGLNGISDQTLEMHFKLYEGYVKGTNDLNQRIADILADGVVDQDETPTYSELTRRLGFEYNGMVLHELDARVQLKEALLIGAGLEMQRIERANE